MISPYMCVLKTCNAKLLMYMKNNLHDFVYLYNDVFQKSILLSIWLKNKMYSAMLKLQSECFFDPKRRSGQVCCMDRHIKRLFTHPLTFVVPHIPLLSQNEQNIIYTYQMRSFILNDIYHSMK